MTDAYLMEADCIHGIVWYDCKECTQQTRQLVDVLMTFAPELGFPIPNDADAFVASLLADGPAEHTIVCPTCNGVGRVAAEREWTTAVCPDCTNGRQTIEVIARVKRD